MKKLVWRYARLITLALCGFMSLMALAFAQPPGSSSSHRIPLERLVETLGLDEKTQTEVNQILDASNAEYQELRRKLREADERMRALLEQEKPDEAAVMAQADTIGTLETEARKQRLRTMLRVRSFLTPEQRAKLLEMMHTRRSRGFRRPRSSEHHHRKSPENSPAQEGP